MASTTISTKEQDFLDEDPAIRGQNYVCMSFLSPEDLLANKEVFYFQKYLEHFVADLNKIANEASAMNPDLKRVVNNLKDAYPHLFDPKDLQDHYRYFKANDASKHDKEFDEANQFRTSVRGIKVRGVFDTVQEAKNRADFLKRKGDKFDIFIGQVGCWCPWSPNPEDIQDQEFAETQLNTFMKAFKDNMAMKDEMFEKRKQERVQVIADALDKPDPWTTDKAGPSK